MGLPETAPLTPAPGPARPRLGYAPAAVAPTAPASTSPHPGPRDCPPTAGMTTPTAGMTPLDRGNDARRQSPIAAPAARSAATAARMDGRRSASARQMA